MDAAPSTRYSLVLRIQDPQNRAAWAEFVAIYEPVVYRYACQKGLQHADACDLCQDVFRAVAGAAKRWTPDPSRGSFRGWLFRIAKNLVIDFLRRERRHPAATGDSDMRRLIEDHTATADPCAVDIEEDYRRHLFQLAARSIEGEFSTTTWQAFWRTSVEIQSVVCVADALDMSSGAVYIARSRVLARLRQRVTEIEGGD